MKRLILRWRVLVLRLRGKRLARPIEGQLRDVAQVRLMADYREQVRRLRGGGL